jgi:hypothetical protein
VYVLGDLRELWYCNRRIRRIVPGSVMVPKAPEEVVLQSPVVQEDRKYLWTRHRICWLRLFGKDYLCLDTAQVPADLFSELVWRVQEVLPNLNRSVLDLRSGEEMENFPDDTLWTDAVELPSFVHNSTVKKRSQAIFVACLVHSMHLHGVNEREHPSAFEKFVYDLLDELVDQNVHIDYVTNERIRLL